MPLSRDTPAGVLAGARPFASAEDAWFWTMAALSARQAGSRPVLAAGAVARPCRPDDVLQVLRRLYQNRRITLEHGRVLRRYGERGVSPDPRRHSRDQRIWSEAMQRLGGLLRQRGWIVAALAAPMPMMEPPAPSRVSTEARLLAHLQALGSEPAASAG